MAASLRIVRRSPGTAVATRSRSLTAASQPITDPSRAFKMAMNGSARGDDWQSKAWDMLDQVGELRYYVGWRSSSVARVRLIASEIDPNTGLPTGGLAEDEDGNLSREQQRVMEIVRAIAGGPQGQSQLLRRGTEHLTVPGETYLFILNRPEGFVWQCTTKDEIKSSARETTVELPSGDRHTYNPSNGDSWFRIWNPRPRRAKECDSPVRASLDSLHEIVRTTKTISNASKSRLIGNGVVFVPQEMSLPSMNAPVASNKPGAPVPPLLGSPAVQALQELLFQVAQTAYDDEDSMAALIPMFAGAPGELIKNVHHLKFDNSVTDIAIKTRNDAIARLAMGLDVTPERLLGLGSNSNHWSAWQLADDDVRLHIAPPVETMCQAINDQVLRIVLTSEGIDPTKYMLWYDASALTADPDQTEEAKDAFDRGAITAEALVAMLGLATDAVYDFSTPEGWTQWAQDKASVDPTLLAELQPLIPALANIEFPQPQVALPPGNDPNQQDDTSTEGGPPDTEDDTANEPGNAAAVLNDIEVALVETLVFRAVELAGKRMRTRSLPDELRALPERELVRRLPPVRIEQIGELVRGWDTVFNEPSIRRLDLNFKGVRAAVERAVRLELARTIDGEVS